MTPTITDDDNVLAEQEPATITHRRGQTKFLEPHEEVDDGDNEIPRLGRAAATLCRLAFGLAKAPDIRSHGRCGAERPIQRNADRCRRAAAVAARLSTGKPTDAESGDRRLAHRLRIAVSSRAQFSGLDRAARRRSGAGPQRHGRQHARQPRQQGRRARHQRHLRPVRRGKRADRLGAPLLDRSGTRSRSRRPGIHAGRGRHGGRGASTTSTGGRSWPKT